jgi:hypothetical protein
MNYTLGSDKLERMALDKIKSKLSEDEERKLTTDMRELYDRLLPTADIECNRQKLVLKLEKLFNDEWPGHDIRVNLFGSSGNLLCSDDSDGRSWIPFTASDGILTKRWTVDICITTEWKELEGVCMIAELLAKRESLINPLSEEFTLLTDYLSDCRRHGEGSMCFLGESTHRQDLGSRAGSGL